MWEVLNTLTHTYYYISPSVFFTQTLADGFPLESEWQIVSSGLQDSSQYFGRPQQYFSLDRLSWPSNF